MRVKSVLFGLLGTVSTGFGLSVLLAPEWVRSVGGLAQFLDLADSADPTGLMLVAGIIVGGYATLIGRSKPSPDKIAARTDAENRFETAGDRPPEQVTAGKQTTAGAELDTEIDAAIERGDASMETVQEEIATVATNVYMSVTDESAETARRAIEQGSWTTDPVAGAFLSGASGPTPTVRSRIALWLRPQQERERRIRRTISAIQRLEEAR